MTDPTLTPGTTEGTITFASHVGLFFKQVKTDLAGLFTSTAHAIVTGFEALLTSIEVNGGPLLIEAAQKAVIAAETTGGSGSQKLAAAQAAVVEEMTTAGLTVAMNAVNGAIEAAVASLQSGALGIVPTKSTTSATNAS